ncbi:MAG: DUF1819 domain-containing protein [Gammaproteobacteria bacterium]|nr:MAG: DUF1819 domain-containing protein [Gammaproteobacteria bacterium]
MVDFEYDSDLTGGSLMVRESRIVAGLMLDKTTPEEWDQAIRVENILQKKSPASAKRNAQAIRRRLERIEPEFWRALRDGDEELATQVAFCAALERNLLLVEFMERVMRDAYVTHTEKLAVFQWTNFLEECAHRDPNIHDWKESSKKKMGQVAFRMLAEMGYLKSTRTLQLQHVVIRPEIKTMLDDNYCQRIRRCMEVSFKGTH